MSINGGGGGRPGRGPALNRLVEGAKRKKQYQKAYDSHLYDGHDIDSPEAEPA